VTKKEQKTNRDETVN